VGLLALQAFVATMVLQAVPVPGPIPAGWADVAFALAGAAALARLAQRRRRPPMVGGAVPAALGYAAWLALSAAMHRAGGWPALGVLELALLLPVTCVLVDDDATRDHLARTWIWSAAAWCLAGLASAIAFSVGAGPSWLFDGSGELGLPFRPAGLTRVGMLAQASLAPILLLVADGRRLVGRWRMPLLVLIGATVALTLTRTLVAVGAGLLVWHALATGRRRATIAGVAALGLVLLLSMRLDVHGSGGALAITSRPGIRWRIAASALDAVRANPLLGKGPAERAARAGWPGPDDPPSEWDAHDTALDIAATRGLPALLFYLAALVLAARQALGRERTPLQVALLAALAATALDAVAVDVEDARHVWLLLALATVGAEQRQVIPPHDREAL